MKILYITGILLMFFAQSVVSIPKDVQKMYVDYVNRARDSFAENLPAANINELVYDESLERTFSSCQTAQKEAQFDNRVIMFRDEKLKHELFFDSEGEAQRLLNDKGKKPDFFKKLFHSQLTSIGCVKLDKPCARPEDDSPKVHENDKATGMCFFDGPANAKITANLKRGKPATQCPNGKSQEYKNLCKSSKSETSSGSLVSTVHILIGAIFIMISFYF